MPEIIVVNRSADECANRLIELANQVRYAQSAPLPKKMAAAQRALDTAQLVLSLLHDRLRAIEERRLTE